MEPIYMSIQQKETGNRIRALLKKNGYTVRDIQGAMGFENPQAVYKWISGKSLPSLDNFIILSNCTSILYIMEANTADCDKEKKKVEISDVYKN